MSKVEFVHLHCHSEYSLLDGASRIPDMAATAAEMGMPAIALTDHGAMYGAIEFYKACLAADVKPIIGCETYVAPRHRTQREGQQDREPSHLVLLAKNLTGYRNLIKLVTAGHLEGFYYKPRIDREILAQHSEGLLLSTSCIAGEVPRAILDGHIDRAIQLAGQYREIVGAENFYLELQDHGLREQHQVNAGLLEMARKLDAPLVAANDSHYTERTDADMHDVLLCIQTGKKKNDPDRMSFTTQEFYLKSGAEMHQLFSDHPEALRNTLRFAEMCNLELDLDTIHMPDFEVPSGFTLDSYLEHLCMEALPEKYPGRPQTAVERLQYELKVIRDKGYSGYFLIVGDLVRFCRSRGIFCAGRGSAAGSVVSYLLGITYMDPLATGLFFERFLNPERESSPDIDLDIEDSRRGEVMAYVVEKYHPENVAQIITFGTMAARAAIRDAGRAMDFAPSEVDQLAKLIPTGKSISKSLEEVPELRQQHQSDPRIRELIETAQSIEGLTRHASVHACGVVISKDPLTEHVPLQRATAGEDQTVVTQYAGPSVEAVGLVKMDFLGLKNLSVISDTLRLIKENRGIELDLTQIPMDDKPTYDMLSRGESTAVFQLESSGMRQLLRDLRPSRFEHIAPLLALYRPGPMDQIPRFVAGRHGRPVQYRHPDLEPILKETFGVLLYQEQVMQTAVTLAGFTMPQAEILMRAMSKKQRGKMATMRELFLRNCATRQIDPAVAEQIYDEMYSFSDYGFNKSHSVAYAVISYRTAYLKANYPQEYMAAYMTSFEGNSDKITTCIQECRRLKVEVLPPDINTSRIDFSVDGEGIRFGLGAVKGVGEAAIAAITQAREEGGPFLDLFDFAQRVPQRTVTKAVTETLIRCGAFDSLLPNRGQALAALDTAMSWGARRQREAEAGQGSLFGDAIGIEEPKPPLPTAPDLPPEERLAAERELLGLFISDHPLRKYQKTFDKYVTHDISELPEALQLGRVVVGGMLTRCQRHQDKKGQTMMFLTIEDVTGSVEVIMFASVFASYGSQVAPDAIVLLEGKPTLGKGRNEDNVQLLCQRVNRIDQRNDIDIEPLAAPRQGGNRKLPESVASLPALVVHINVSRDHASRETFTRLRAILQRHPGDSAVSLFVHDGLETTVVGLGSSFNVGASDALRDELEALLGPRTVRFLETAVAA